MNIIKKIIKSLKRSYYVFVYQLDKGMKTKDKGSVCYWNWIVNSKNNYIGFYLFGKSRFSKRRIQFVFKFDKPYRNRDYAIVARLFAYWKWVNVKIHKSLDYNEYLYLHKKGKLPNPKKYSYDIHCSNSKVRHKG